MSHDDTTAFVGTYDSVDAASADFDAVGALHHGGGLGHVEAAIISRDSIGKLSWDRHERIGGMHMSHSPSDTLVRLSDQLDSDTVELVVLGDASDTAKAATAAAGAKDPRTVTIEHQSMADGFFSGGGGQMPSGHTGYEDGSVGHLGV